MVALGLVLAGCAKTPPRTDLGSKQVGYASWYGPKFHGKTTASGEPYDMYAMTAAHRTAAFGTRVRVENLDNQKSTIVRINDRGPFVHGRIIDLSYTAAKEIGLLRTGTARVRLQFMDKVLKTGRFFLQLGSFRELGNAQEKLRSLQGPFKGEKLRIVEEGGLHRVWMGPFTTREDAEVELGRAKQKGYPSFVLSR